MSNIVFLFPNVTGHINRVIKIAKTYQKEGHEVYFGGTVNLLPFIHIHGFKHYMMNSLPFGVGLEDNVHEKQKYLESLFNRISGKLLKQRKDDMHKMISDLRPSMIFLDSFNFSDFIHLYPKAVESAKIVQIQTKFPMHYSPNLPPLMDFAFPGRDAKVF